MAGRTRVKQVPFVPVPAVPLPSPPPFRAQFICPHPPPHSPSATSFPVLPSHSFPPSPFPSLCPSLHFPLSPPLPSTCPSLHLSLPFLLPLPHRPCFRSANPSRKNLDDFFFAPQCCGDTQVMVETSRSHTSSALGGVKQSRPHFVKIFSARVVGNATCILGFTCPFDGRRAGGRGV